MGETKYLAHFGIPGQKWGERRYQYEDGSLTPEGKIRYGRGGKPIGPNRKLGKSKNPLLKRRINETHENRVKRGEQLRTEGRTMPGAIGRAYVRDILTSSAISIPVGLLIGGLGVGALTDKIPIDVVSGVTNAAVAGLGIVGSLLSGSLAVRAYQDIADMNAYDHSERR